MVSAILQVSMPSNRGQDRIIWHFDRKGAYSIKLGYKVLMEEKAFSLSRPFSSSETQGVF